MNQQLTMIGDALERAVASELRHATWRRPRWRSSRTAAAVALTVVALPAAAYAATNLLTAGQVAASLPQGTKALIGTDPTCRVVTANIEYHCVLATAPTTAFPPPTRPVPSQSVHVAVTDASGRRAVISLHSGQDVERALRTLHRLSHARVIKVTTLPNNGLANSTTTTTGSAINPSSKPFDWTGTVEPTVNATKHVNGGCRAQNAAGTDWECYIGQTAVSQNIISQSFLGQYAPAPGVG